VSDAAARQASDPSSRATVREPMLDPVTHDVRSRLVGVLFWIVLPVLAGYFLLHAIDGYHANAHRKPSGLTGTFLVTNRSCFGNVCQTAGTFVSDDGTFRENNVLGDYRWRVGERHHIVYKRDSPTLSLAPRWNPTATVVGATGGVILLALWATFLIGWLLGRRRPHP
jgi:hypothetical protein